ncbi:succinyl-diaminopimelate desuccinylase [Idiomarina tyrosinivorans]
MATATEMTQHPTLRLAHELLARASITPADEGCQTVIAERLRALGFSTETMVFEDTTNLWARTQSDKPVFCFAGHTDVVPTGDPLSWRFPPFQPTEHDGYLYARGAADMKGSLAAMIVATERFMAEHTALPFDIAYLITSDEEGPFINGTKRVIETLQQRQQNIDWCIVGEPSSTHTIGDIVKNGRRGSLSLSLTIIGQQGHVAYPHLADNPVHRFAPLLQRLVSEHWDNGNAFFPATTFQISNIHAGTGAGNVIPGELQVEANFRFSTEVTAEQLQQRVEALIAEAGITAKCQWKLNGEAFVTEAGVLLDIVQQSISHCTGQLPQLSTAGGTSDGRFIAPTGAQVVELGPVNATIHKVNECVKITDLIALTDIYYQVLKGFYAQLR